MLHRLAELDGPVREAYANFDYKKVVSLLSHFMTSDLSAFYFDIRKDTLYCEPPSSAKRRASLQAIEHIFRALTVWLAPILPFTCEESWLSRYPDAVSVHLEIFPAIPGDWLNKGLWEKWADIRRARSVVTGALEIERANNMICTSMVDAQRVFIADAALRAQIESVDFAEICITSGLAIVDGEGPADAFRLSEVPGVAVVVERAPGVKCARSWKYFDPAEADPEYPGVTPRDAKALRELKALGRWA